MNRLRRHGLLRASGVLTTRVGWHMMYMWNAYAPSTAELHAHSANFRLVVMQNTEVCKRYPSSACGANRIKPDGTRLGGDLYSIPSRCGAKCQYQQNRNSLQSCVYTTRDITAGNLRFHSSSSWGRLAHFFELQQKPTFSHPFTDGYRRYPVNTSLTTSTAFEPGEFLYLHRVTAHVLNKVESFKTFNIILT